MPTFAVVLLLAGTTSMAAGGESLPKADPPFAGVVGASLKDSKPDWPRSASAPRGAPNVVLIMLDDVGFGASSTFGGPAATPELDKLAAQGLRYNNFNTAALCSPTRAALLTGRNHHQSGNGLTPEVSLGFPGYDVHWGRDMASVAEVLRLNGYSTAGFGKWHNTPTAETGPAGPFDRWPTKLGFEYFYGFHGGATSQWEPRLFRDTLLVDPPATPAQGYHLTTDLVDDAIHWLQQQRSLVSEKPYFLYFATGATHEPHHVPQEWIARYRGKFDQGWDRLREETFARQKALGVIPTNAVLTPRPKELPVWSSLSADEQRVFARQMEIYAGFLSHTDYEVGRLLQAIHASGDADNTLVIYLVGDNGGSGDGDYTGSLSSVEDIGSTLAHLDELGGPLHMNNYAVPWGWATSAPFQWMKQVASHFGGTRNPMLVAWPGHIVDPGGLRMQFQHVTDIVPTIYQAAGIRFPDQVNGVKQTPLAGHSFVTTFNHPGASSDHPLQYFEILGNRSIYDRGWVAAARHGYPWDFSSGNHPFETDRWELYHVDEDFSEAHDLADRYPAKLAALKRKFDDEARRNKVYPLTGALLFSSGASGRPTPADGKKAFTFYADQQRIPNYVLPDITQGSHTIEARVFIPREGAQGILLAAGSRRRGFALFIDNGHLIYDNNSGQARDSISSGVELPRGRWVDLRFDYLRQPDGGGSGRLYVEGVAVGSGVIAKAAGIPTNQFLEIGEQRQSPVSKLYRPPFRFTGTIDKVRLRLD